MRTSFKSIAKSIPATLLAVVWCWSVAAQPSAAVNEQLRRQYVPTMLFDPEGAVSLVSLEGTVFTVRASGIKANPEFIAGYTPNYYSQGGSVTQPGSSGKRAPRTRVATVEDLPVGTRVDATNIVITDGSVTFNLQTCTDLHPGTPQKHRAALTFQFQTGAVNSSNLKLITDTIAEVLTVVEQPPPVPGVYVNTANNNSIQLNPDASFVAQDTGRSLTGRYSFNSIPLAIQNKANLQLSITETGATVFLGLQDGKITDQAGNAWAKQSTDGAASTATQRPGPLASAYVSSQNSGDRLQLNRDNTFSLQEGGQSFSGTYSVAGSTLKLHIVQLQKDVDIAIQGNRLIVNGDEVWIQQD
jgi:hypothetical protein